MRCDHQVKHGMEGVEVSTRTGAVRGSVVIVTVPLHILQTGSVEFDPPLPESKVSAIHGLAMGAQVKTCAAPTAPPQQFL